MRSDIGCDTVDRSVAETWFYCNIYSLKFVGLEKSKKGKIDWENSPWNISYSASNRTHQNQSAISCDVSQGKKCLILLLHALHNCQNSQLK